MKYTDVQTCDLCHGTEQRVLFYKAPGMCVVRCMQCGFVFLNPQIVDEDRPAWGVNPLLVQDEPWRRIDDRRRLDEIQQTVATGNLLDVGSYCGFFLDEARTRGFNVTGLEISAQLAQYARERFGLDVRQGTLDTAPFAPASFEVITLFHVLEHLSSPTRALQRIRTLQAPGGLLVIEVPKFDSLAMRALRARHRYIMWGHPVYFETATLRRLLAMHGYRIIRARTVPRIMSLPWALLRLSPSIPLAGDQLAKLAAALPASKALITLNVGDILRVHAIRE